MTEEAEYRFEHWRVYVCMDRDLQKYAELQFQEPNVEKAEQEMVAWLMNFKTIEPRLQLQDISIYNSSLAPKSLQDALGDNMRAFAAVKMHKTFLKKHGFN